LQRLTKDLADSFGVGGWLGILDCFELVLSGLDTIWCKGDSKVGNFLVSEHAFLQINLQVILVQSGQKLVKYFEELLVSVCMHQ